MSIKVMTYVWDGLPFAGSDLLAMLALADWCDDMGGSLYPSIKAVADKVRVGEKHARNILRKFEDERYLAVVGNHFGGKPGTTREYRLNVPKLKQLADDANAKKEDAKRAKYAKGGHSEAAWEDVFQTTPLQVTPTTPPQFQEGSPVVPLTPPLQGSLSTTEPSIDPPKRNTRADAPTAVKADSSIAKPEAVSQEVWGDFLSLRKEKRAKLTSTALAGIRREADKAGWTLENALTESCARGWTGFKAEWVAPKATASAMAAGRRTPAPENFAARTYTGGKL